MDIQKQDGNRIPIALKKLSQTTLCVSLMAGDWVKAASCLPSKLNLAIKEPPICDLVKIVGKGKIVIFVKLELAKLSERISVGNNLNQTQVEFIATQLVDYFPNESLADFKICFERGAMGQYGEIFRMDGIVIRKWMEQYLEEKYTIVEDVLKKEKEDMYKPVERTEDERHKDWLVRWQNEVGGVGQKVPGLTDEDVLKYGQKDPVRVSHTRGWKYFDVGGGYQMFASTQEHANEMAAIARKNKML